MAFTVRRFSSKRRIPNTLWVAAGRSTTTSERLVDALHECGIRARHVDPKRLSVLARSDDVVLGRLDVRPTLDGVEDGIWELRRVERRGIRVLNPAPSLMACHDKLRTCRALLRFGLPQPQTLHVEWDTHCPLPTGPVVVKPRFGSWGRDVVRCASEADLERCLSELRRHAWFRQQGALVQTLVPPLGFDLRLVVAGGRIVGAIERVAAPSEWRTNVSLGGTRRPVNPPRAACALALAAAAAVEGDLVGVDLLPLANGQYVVLEVNGAVDFTDEYSLIGQNVFVEVAALVANSPAELEVDGAQLGG
jgi:[lysine-biosynthesis-protein LysW]---L-2-aminoadipate ligase